MRNFASITDRQTFCRWFRSRRSCHPAYLTPFCRPLPRLTHRHLSPCTTIKTGRFTGQHPSGVLSSPPKPWYTFHTFDCLAMASQLDEQPVPVHDDVGTQQGPSGATENSDNNDAVLSPESPIDQQSLRHRPSNITTASKSNPNHSTVNLDFFDPAGAQELRRTLSRKSKEGHDPSSSDLTLNGLELGDGPFDLERFLRNLINKCVPRCILSLLVLNDFFLSGGIRPTTSRGVSSACSSRTYAL